MGNISTVEGAQFVLSTHLKKDSFLYNFFNTGVHIHEDHRTINLELKYDTRLYTINNIQKIRYVLNHKIITALKTFKNENANKKRDIYIFESLDLADELASFFSTVRKNGSTYHNISNFSSPRTLFMLNDIGEQTKQFNQIKSNYFKHIRIPALSTIKSAERFYSSKIEEKIYGIENNKISEDV